jgi:hypothetical protein
MKYALPGIAVVLVATAPARALSQTAPEHVVEICDDGVDNDADGFTDCIDQDCSTFAFCAASASPPPAPPAPSPENTLAACRDGVDNDADGFTDCTDQDCLILTMCAQPGQPWDPYGAPRPARKPHVSRGGIGFLVPVMVFGQANHELELSDEWGSYTQEMKFKSKATAGIGLFGEKLVHPRFAIGGEAVLIFPEPDEIKFKVCESGWGCESYPWEPSPISDTSIIFTAALRMKWPIPAGQWLAVYPLLSLGLLNVTARWDDADGDSFNYLGATWSAGMGMEFYTPAPVTPFMEIRYLGGFGVNTEKGKNDNPAYGEETKKDQGILNSVLVSFGTRFM